jgi:hypothetical protein
MARNGKSRNSGKSKIEPSQLTMSFILANPTFRPEAPATQYYYIDLSQCASLLNRRFYRQGLNWAVAGMKIFTPPSTIANLMLNKLPNTWVMANSWEKGMRAWMRLNKEALSESQSVRPRFLDFKVYANSLHAEAGIGNNQLPISSLGGSLGATVTPGEWEASKFVVPDTTSPVGGVNNFEILAVGASYPGAGFSGLNSVSLIEGYASSRGLPEVRDPNAPDDATDADGPTPENFLSALFNDGTTQTDNVLTDMVFENNQAPYPFENDGIHLDTMYPGGANQLQGLELHDQANVSGTSVGGTTRLKGGNFPCGLIEIAYTPTEGGVQPILQIDLIPGMHRGYLAETMTEM